MPTGLELIRAEMARQHADALTTFEQSRNMAGRVAESLHATGRLILLGMGGSHFVNRIGEPLYRAQGIDATALVASEVLRAPLPAGKRTVMLTSQSGGSGEILRYLERAAAGEERFGMTLNADSRLGRAVPCLVATGGPERAFAATRSLVLSLIMHGAILRALGLDGAPLVKALQAPRPPSVQAAVEHLAECHTIVYSGRGMLEGVAEAASLGLMELARLPAFAMEGGQLQHGPLEILEKGVGVVLFRPAGPDGKTTIRLAEVADAAGSPVVVFDVSGERPIPRVTTIALPRAEGLASALLLFPALQETMIGIASRHVEKVGEPIRTAKVTDGE
ncbi:MAG TPA: SIS domain-containing protein [Candidatus Cybelea sp.]|nr:SIS domain-containing protein [Candidatus Cybelea sp.]